MISIIVSVYKIPEKYLRKCIESCMAQTLKEIEILLVDDGSPDNCGQICDEYAANDKRIKVIHKHNGGLSAARNTGFLSSIGEWIMFVDGDDWIEPDMCEKMYTIGISNGVGIVICAACKDFGKTSIPWTYNLDCEKIYKDEECKWLQQQLLVYNSNIATVPAKLIRRCILEKNLILHNETLRQGAEGIEFNLRLFDKIESAVFTDEIFYHYIYNDTSISSSHDEKNHQYVISCFKKIKEFIEQSDNKDQLMPWFYNRMLYVIITTAISGYFSPTNQNPYRDKKKKYKEYLKQPIVEESLANAKTTGLSNQRKIIIWMIRHKIFIGLWCLGIIRRFQKKHLKFRGL